MSKINIGEFAGRMVKIDLEIGLTSRFLFTADSGGGKSWLIRRFSEQAFGRIQQIIIDPEGEFSTLREKFPFVLAGKGGDTPADVRSAGLLAHRLLELNASAVCDLYEMRPSDRHLWVKSFLEAMINAPKTLWHPVLVIVDEAHVYCPEHGKGESIAANAMIDLCSRGRKRGFCAVWATQRLAVLNKDASSNLQNRLIGPTFEDVNRKRAAEILGIVGKPEMASFYKTIQTLEPGMFFGLGRAISKERILFSVGGVQTTHPEVGKKHSLTPPPAPDKVKTLLPQLADLPKEAAEEAQTSAELKKRIRELEQRLRSVPKAVSTAPVVDERAIAKAVEAGRRELVKQLQSVKDRMKHIHEHGWCLDPDCEFLKTEHGKRFAPAVTGKLPAIVQLGNDIQALASSINISAAPQSKIPTPARQSSSFSISPSSGSGLPPIPISSLPVPRIPRIVTPPLISASAEEIRQDKGYVKAVKLVLSVLVQHGAITRRKCAMLAGYAVAGGGFGNAMSFCNVRNLIASNGDQISITDLGREVIGEVEPLRTGRELLVHFQGHVDKAAREILRVLAENPNGPMSNRDVAALTRSKTGEPYDPDGGAFGNALSTLRTLEIITGGERAGGIRFTDEFQEAIS